MSIAFQGLSVRQVHVEVKTLLPEKGVGNRAGFV